MKCVLCPRISSHLQRLQSSADGTELVLPYSLEQITAAIEALIDAYPGDSGYLRLVVTRGSGSLGIDPRKCARPSLFIIADELLVMDVTDSARGVSLHVAETRRTPVQCLNPKVKSLNYLNNILARLEANRAGCDEALMLNLDGFVAEGSVDNVFIVVDGVLKTPRLEDGMLEGITRQVVIDVAARAGIACEQTSLRVEDLQQADECFLTGTGAELIPVRAIGGKPLALATAPILPVIMQGFHDSIAQYCLAG